MLDYVLALNKNLSSAIYEVQQHGKKHVPALEKAAGYVQRFYDLNTGRIVDTTGVLTQEVSKLRSKYEYARTLLKHHGVTKTPRATSDFVETKSFVLSTFVGLPASSTDSLTNREIEVAVNNGSSDAGVDLPEPQESLAHRCVAGEIWHDERGQCVPEGSTRFTLFLSDYKLPLIVAGAAGALVVGALVFKATMKPKKNPGRRRNEEEFGKNWDEAWQRIHEAWSYHLRDKSEAHVRLRIQEALLHANQLPPRQREVVMEKIEELERKY